MSEAQYRVYKVVKDFIDKNKCSPSQKQICEMTGKSNQTIRDHLDRLRRKGYIHFYDNTPYTIKILKDYNNEEYNSRLTYNKNTIKYATKSELRERIDKAIEYIEEIVSDTKGIIDTYNYEDKEETIKRYIEDLETDIKHYEYLLDILKGGNNE